VRLAIPGYVLSGLHPELERLIFRFEKARRRAYTLKRKDIDRLTILRELNGEIRIPARYVSTAYDMIKALPPHVTFGGKKTQQLRQRGKISAEEYRLRKNRILACRGEAGQKGNLCLRIVNGKLRVTVSDKKWIQLPIFIPKKYMPMLRRVGAHTVLIKRRVDKRGYDVRIIVDAEVTQTRPAERTMTLDINSGHVDFAVADTATLKPVAFGKFNCHEFLDARKGKKKTLTHRLVNKVRNIAKHYGAEVVAGKLRTSFTDSYHDFNRRIQGMNQYAMRQIMSYKLPLGGVKFMERSEANTSLVGEQLSKPLGLDVHKASAYAFAVKVVDYDLFKSFLYGARADEGDGIPSIGLNGGSGQTVLHQSCPSWLMHSDPPSGGEATPNQGKGGWQTMPVQTSILQVKV